MNEKPYKSQIEYGVNGANICTPVCCVVACKYIINNDNIPIFSFFTEEIMEDIMKVCHTMYSECFAWKGKNMMLKDIQEHFPSYVEYREIAGLTKNGDSEESIEELLIKPLDVLIGECKYHHHWAIIATYLNHTVCYLFDGDGEIYYFNSLPASIKNVTRDISQTLPPRDVQYSGLIMKQNDVFKK